MALLPTLVHDIKTRVAGEVLVYYNLGNGKKIGALVVGADAVEKLPASSCGGSQDCPSGGFPAAVIIKPNEAALTVSSGGTFPLKSPVNAALEIDDALSDDINDYDLTYAGAAVGDSVEVWCLPTPSDDVLICFEQGFSPEVGEVFRPVPRKMTPADHFVRQRPENSISLTDILVSAWDGLQRINGIRVTLIAKVYPDSGSTPSQINYYTGAQINVPSLDNPSDANESIEITGEGRFDQALIFAAQPS